MLVDRGRINGNGKVFVCGRRNTFGSSNSVNMHHCVHSLHIIAKVDKENSIESKRCYCFVSFLKRKILENESFKIANRKFLIE